MKARREITLPEELCALAEQSFGKQYQSIEAFLEFVLRELLCGEGDKLDKAEKSIIEQRLRDLGYL